MCAYTQYLCCEDHASYVLFVTEHEYMTQVGFNWADSTKLTNLILLITQAHICTKSLANIIAPPN